MEKTSIFRYYKLGQLIEKFREVQKPNHLELYNWVTMFFDFIEELDLKVTSKALSLANIKQFFKKLDILARENPKEIVSPELLQKINKAISQLLNTFEAELNTKEVFILQDKMFGFEVLLEKQENLFTSKDVFFEAPMEVQFNVKKSAICLALGRNIACAFHMLLATEGYIRFFNNFYFEDSEGAVNKLTFYELTKETQEILKELKYKNELLSLIHIIRKDYRNQTQHSIRKFTESEASKLFIFCLKVMNGLFNVLKGDSKLDFEEIGKQESTLAN